MPVDIQAAQKAGRSPRLTLMPLAFATILGGLVTLIGTPPNIIASSLRARELGAPYQMFDFAPVGLAVAVAGLIFVALFGWRLIPKGDADNGHAIDEEEFTAELSVPDGSAAVGKYLSQLDSEAEGAGVVTVGLVRNDRRLPFRGRVSAIEPGDALVDCTGCKSLLRDHLAADVGAEGPGANTLSFRLEYAAVITFVYGQSYECNEYCKYYKNADNPRYKFIPAVQRTSYDGTLTHVTGIVNITAEDYSSMPPRCDGAWLRTHHPDIGRSMDRFIDTIREETNGEIVGDLEILRIPLELYRARNATSRQCNGTGSRHPLAGAPVFLAGDSAMGSPYFQSISLGFECAMYLTQLLARRDLPLTDLFDRYELYMHKQWMRVYTRTKMIKHNKDLFEAIDDPFAILDLLHIY